MGVSKDCTESCAPAKSSPNCLLNPQPGRPTNTSCLALLQERFSATISPPKLLGILKLSFRTPVKTFRIGARVSLDESKANLAKKNGKKCAKTCKLSNRQ